jgi:hypothetical protein
MARHAWNGPQCGPYGSRGNHLSRLVVQYIRDDHTRMTDRPPKELTSGDDIPNAARPAPAGGLAEMLLVAAAVCLGCAIQVNNGNYSPRGLLLLTIALGCGLLAVGGRPAWWGRGGTAAGDRSVGVLLGLGILVQLVLLFTRDPAPLPSELQRPVWFRGMLCVAAVFAAMLLPALGSDARVWRRLQRAAFAGLLLVHLAMGVWVLRAVPYPFTDVIQFQHDADNALLRGENPYALQFVDLSHGTSKLYAPGTQHDGKLDFGFPYPPLSALLTLPAHVLGPKPGPDRPNANGEIEEQAGDLRYAQLLAITVSAALMALAGRGPVAPAAAALFLLTPRGFYVLSQGWTEPLVVLMLAATVFAACRRSRATPYVLGLFWAVKQYVVLSAPLTLLLIPAKSQSPAGGLWGWRNAWAVIWRWGVKAAALALAVTLPFVLWGPKHFWWSAVAVQVRQPFRPDALSYAAGLYAWRGIALPTIIAFLALAGVMALALARTPRTPSGFAAATAVTFAVFFALNKQAFANYYYFVIGALVAAVAASGTPGVGDDVRQSTKSEARSPKQIRNLKKKQ